MRKRRVTSCSCVDREPAVLAHAGAPARGAQDLLVALAGHAADDVAEHLHEAPVGVPGEVLVARACGQPAHRLVVEAEVEDRLEHPGHRVARAGAHRDQQRIVGVAEPAPGALLEPGDAVGDLLGQPGGLDAAVAHERHARLGGDREPGGHEVRAEDAGHLGDVRALAAEQHAHLARAVGEVVDVAGREAEIAVMARFSKPRAPSDMRRSYGRAIRANPADHDLRSQELRLPTDRDRGHDPDGSESQRAT